VRLQGRSRARTAPGPGPLAGTVATLVPVLLAACTVAAAAQAVPSAPLSRAEITFAMRATVVKDFMGRAPVARAEFSGSDLSSVTGVVELNVAEMRTGIRLRDAHMREAMHADSFPTIRFDLARVTPTGAGSDSILVTLDGNLTIHGVTRTVQVPAKVVIYPQGAAVTASFPVDMREYGIVPPTRSILLGTIRVEPVTWITARLHFGRTEP
jgi:polyisoprenoid-binding protein YceI